MRRPLIIGHRGFPGRFPDNSVGGVRAALEAGADGVEVDVRPCLDGTWVCHHDMRLGGVPIIEMPYEAFRRAGGCPFSAIASIVPADRWFYVEVKPLPPELLEPNLEALADMLIHRVERTLVLSSSPMVLQRVGDMLPGARCSLVLDRMPSQVPRGVELSPHHPLIERLLPLGLPLHPWTVNRPARLRALTALAVESITTNRPDVALETLGA